MSPTSSGRPSPRLGLVLAAVAIALFLLQIVALALGWIEVALACAALFVVGWFVLRARLRGPAG